MKLFRHVELDPKPRRQNEHWDRDNQGTDQRYYGRGPHNLAFLHPVYFTVDLRTEFVDATPFTDPQS